MTLKKLLAESLLATVLVFVVLFLLFQLVSISFKPFNYVAKTIKEINLNDLYFSSLANNSVDTNIIIINIEDIDRKGITEVLTKALEAKPSVIGLDVFFSNHRQTQDDSLLLAILNENKDIIVAARNFNSSNKPDENYWPLDFLVGGHAGIITNETNTQVVRYFEPFIMSDDSKIWSFSAEIVKRYDTEKFEMLTKRAKRTEMLNYTGDQYAFKQINYRDLLNYSAIELQSLQNKIVLLGFCGGNTQSTSDYNDIFYSPVGFEMTPNRRPDMYGVVLHANIVSMLLKQAYINTVSKWLTYLLVFLLTFLHLILFAYFYVKKHLYYHVVAKLAQLFSFAVILWLIFLLFSKAHVYIAAKYLILPVILSVDVLYLYEAIAVFVYKVFKRKSIFVHDH